MRLSELRKTKGVSQQVVADFVDVDRSTYSRYENGEVRPDINTITKLAGYFGVSTDYLLGIDNQPKRVLKKR